MNTWENTDSRKEYKFYTGYFMKNKTMLDMDFNEFKNCTKDWDYIVGQEEYRWMLNRDIEYLMSQRSSYSRKNSKSKSFLDTPETKFDCRVTNNPYELLKMGYPPSQSCWKKYYESKNLPMPANDYDIGDEFRKVA